MTRTDPNGIAARSILTSYPGWTVRRYRNGSFDAAHMFSPAVSPGFDSFTAAVDWIKAQGVERTTPEAPQGRNLHPNGSRKRTAILNARGRTIRTSSNRRFVVVAVRTEAIQTEQGWLVAFAEIFKRSDRLATARAAAQRTGTAQGAVNIVIDTFTGEEI